MERDEPEPESFDALLGEITGFLKKTKGIPVDPEPSFSETLTAEDLATQSRLGRHFLYSNLSPKMISRLVSRLEDRREAVRELPNMLIAWKKVVQTAKGVGFSQKAAELAEALTLAKLADIATEVFKKTTENIGTQIPGSIEHQKARLVADYWSVVQEISKEAAEDEERKNF